MEAFGTAAQAAPAETFMTMDEVAEKLHVRKRNATKKMRDAKILISVGRKQYVRPTQLERYLISREGRC